MFWVSWPVVLIDLKYWYDCDFNKFSDEICGTIYHIVRIYNQWFVVFWRQSAEISCEKNIKDVFLYQCCLHWPVTHSGNASFKQFGGDSSFLSRRVPARRAVMASSALRSASPETSRTCQSETSAVWRVWHPLLLNDWQLRIGGNYKAVWRTAATLCPISSAVVSSPWW